MQSSESLEFTLEDVKHELATMCRKDQAYRAEWFAKRDDEIWRAGMKAMDEAHEERLRAIIDVIGWPSRARVGAETSHYAWLLVQHTSLEYQEHCLALIDALEDDNDPRQRAFLWDMMALRHSLPQRYGTQYVKLDGDLVRYDVEDETVLDELREEIGLPPSPYYYDMAASEKADRDGTAFSSLGGWRS
jgi:hypothetical protein